MLGRRCQRENDAKKRKGHEIDTDSSEDPDESGGNDKTQTAKKEGKSARKKVSKWRAAAKQRQKTDTDSSEDQDESDDSDKPIDYKRAVKREWSEGVMGHNTSSTNGS